VVGGQAMHMSEPRLDRADGRRVDGPHRSCSPLSTSLSRAPLVELRARSEDKQGPPARVAANESRLTPAHDLLRGRGTADPAGATSKRGPDLAPYL